MPAFATVTSEGLDETLAILERALGGDPQALEVQNTPLHGVWAALAALGNDTATVVLDTCNPFQGDEEAASEVIQALNQSGTFVLSAWNREDAYNVVAANEDDSLPDSWIEAAADAFLPVLCRRLPDLLGEKGNEALDNLWSANRKEILSRIAAAKAA